MAKKSETITVQVIGQPVCEDGVHYKKGDTFETTPERADALSHLVTTKVEKAEEAPPAE